jgi:WD40 repeat protein
MVTALVDGKVVVWDTQATQPLAERIVRASDDGTAWVWDTQPGRPKTEWRKDQEPVIFAQFSRDDKQVVTAFHDSTVRVWDAQTGQPLTEPLQHSNRVSYAQFSPDGKRIVTVAEASGEYGTARVWDVQTGQPLTEPLKHEGHVKSVQFSPDGKRIAVVEYGDTAQVWDVAPPSTVYPDWLLSLATAVCGEVLTPGGVVEYTNQVQALNQFRQTLSQKSGGDDWLVLGRWLLADPSARILSPFSSITLAEWIERRFNDGTLNSLGAVEQLAISTGDAVLLERASKARKAWKVETK